MLAENGIDRRRRMSEHMRKLDIAFAIALIMVVVLLGMGLLAVQHTRNVIYYSHRAAVPMPEWTRYKMGATST